MEWIKDAAGTLTLVCMLTSVIECLIEDSEHAEGFRLLCAAVVTGAVIKSSTEMLLQLFRG